jgi:hypothetical protein
MYTCIPYETPTHVTHNIIVVYIETYGRIDKGIPQKLDLRTEAQLFHQQF